MAVYEEKFIVINHKHLNRITEDEKKFLHVIFMKLANHNNYYVCNQDEPYAQKVIDIILRGEDEKLSLPVEAQVSLQETEVKLIKTFMNILKRIYAKTDLVDIQTEIESSFENLDDLLLNEYKIDSDISLLSN